MVTLDATIGGESSNSYCDIDFADAFFGNRLNSDAWTDSTADDKKRALIQATDELDRYDWVGEPVTSTQALEWPRSNVYDKNGVLIEDIPSFLKKATCELAYDIIAKPLTDGLEGIEGFDIGPLKLEFSEAAAQSSNSELSDSILRLIGKYMVSSVNSVKILRS